MDKAREAGSAKKKGYHELTASFMNTLFGCFLGGYCYVVHSNHLFFTLSERFLFFFFFFLFKPGLDFSLFFFLLGRGVSLCDKCGVLDMH